MKKGEIYKGTVEKTVFMDKGIINIDGERVAVKECIEGQEVEFRLKHRRERISEGEKIRVAKKSPLETETPACPHFGECGSCKLQTLPYDTQVDRKAAQIKGLLDGVVTTPYEWEGVIKSPSAYEYRNKVEFAFGNAQKDGPITLGFHRKNSFYDIIDTEGCRLVDETVRNVRKCVLELVKEFGYDFYHRNTHEGYLRHLLIRKTYFTDMLMVDLVTSSQAPENEKEFLFELVKRLLGLPKAPDSILHTVSDSWADAIVNDRTDVLYGEDYIYENLLGLKFRITAFSFFQTNSRGAELLYSKTREYVGETKDKVIFDLYSGTGTIAQLLAPVAKHVTGVEIVEEAVEAAKYNAGLNGLKNCTFIADDVLKAIDGLSEKPDIIVLDPPREGINPKALPKILAFGVEHIVYISCKATSLARDLEVIQKSGYRLAKAACVDLFPQVGHVEVCCLLEQQE
ncbi:MAG: 23S rRNA (uracil(1939)-C(5))-methyltransferase RlmD [Lachnospiraceae bacterium]|nr:23S rRNA (uracil(1939)-C(5))-methyltransferase RlmD [Lachnospiraceae bacterium]